MQEGISAQTMGYDRTSIMFSPDGRLLQVEYAKKTVKQGTAAIGIVCKNGVLLIADKRITEKLLVGKSVEKVFQIDDHIGATAAGILSDGRILVEKAQLLAQQHKITYDEPIDVKSLVKEICNIKQWLTQVAGARPFGVGLLFAGVDGNPAVPKLFVTDPTGIFFEFKATAIGENEDVIKDVLNKEYKESMTLQEGIKLAVKALKKGLGKEFNIDRVCGAYVKLDGKFHEIKKEELK